MSLSNDGMDKVIAGLVQAIVVFGDSFQNFNSASPAEKQDKAVMMLQSVTAMNRLCAEFIEIAIKNTLASTLN